MDEVQKEFPHTVFRMVGSELREDSAKGLSRRNYNNKLLSDGLNSLTPEPHNSFVAFYEKYLCCWMGNTRNLEPSFATMTPQKARLFRGGLKTLIDPVYLVAGGQGFKHRKKKKDTIRVIASNRTHTKRGREKDGRRRRIGIFTLPLNL